ANRLKFIREIARTRRVDVHVDIYDENEEIDGDNNQNKDNNGLCEKSDTASSDGTDL
ncbi:hypothetical protein BGX20_000145, partial [Mortierella sp. AD010]